MVSYTRKTDEEVRELALALFKGEIFTSAHLRNQSDVTMVFMPIALGCFSPQGDNNAEKFIDEVNSRPVIEDIAVVYEYMSKAGPRSINGYPCFTSLSFLNKEDWKRVLEKHKEIESALSSI